MSKPLQAVENGFEMRARGGRPWMALLGGAAACLLAVMALAMLPERMVGAEAAEALLAAILLMLLLTAPMAARARGVIDERQQMLLTATLLLGCMMVAERAFYRYSTLGAAYQGNFTPGAYAEAMIWAVCLVVLALVTAHSPGYLRRLFQPSFRWLSFLALFCVASAAYSPAKAFSLAWAGKFLLAVLLLRVVLDEVESMEELRWFLRGSLWSFGLLSALCVVQFVSSPNAWAGGRMTEAISPTGVSAIAATLFLLGLCFYRVDERRRYLLLSVAGFCVMLLGGGKGAIAAALVAGTLFFILHRNLRAGIGFLTATVVLGGVLIAVTPLQHYLTDYVRSGDAATGTGRVGLWKVIIPAIEEKPIIGHGFAASKFIYEDVEGVDWPAGHTHNGFLEVLYNNGVLGLLMLVAVLWRTGRNLLWVLRRVRAGELRTWAIGGFSIFVFELLNGMLNASFGGRPGSSYIMLLSLLVVSETLAGLLQRAQQRSVSMERAAGNVA